MAGEQLFQERSDDCLLLKDQEDTTEPSTEPLGPAPCSGYSRDSRRVGLCVVVLAVTACSFFCVPALVSRRREAPHRSDAARGWRLVAAEVDPEEAPCWSEPQDRFDCDAGLNNWQAGWSACKKTWCCREQQKGCEVVDCKAEGHKMYNCDAGFDNWKLGWSFCKKKYCCKEMLRGCEDPAPTTSPAGGGGAGPPGGRVPACEEASEVEACPPDWPTGDSGGFYCRQGGGCRPADQGPFDAADCPDQCAIGDTPATVRPTTLPAEICDLSACDGCSGTVCLTCKQDEKVKCCLDAKCKGCGGEQCTACRNDHQAECCAGVSPGVPSCPGIDGGGDGGETPKPVQPTTLPAEICDLSACDGCSGTVCLTCKQDEKVKCCLDDKCKGCGGEQCTACRNDHHAECCAGVSPGVPSCAADGGGDGGENPKPVQPTTLPAEICDLSACDGCSGTVCLTCKQDEKVKCCLDAKCKGCGGEQCTACRNDHQAECCAGVSPGVPSCAGTDGGGDGGETPKPIQPTTLPAEICDLSACDGCSGTVCLTCKQDEKVKCCLDDKCKGCSGEQCTACRNDHQEECCVGVSPAVPSCSGTSAGGGGETPVPDNCDLSACDGCSGTVCLTCKQDEQVKCCLDEKCKGCGGEQCTGCRNDHQAECCTGMSPGVPSCPST